MDNFTITELALLVIAGLGAGSYAKSEGADSFLAALVGVVTAILIVLIGVR